MGTPDFAVEALRCLVEGGYNVVGVITMPDKPAGRGHKIQYSPVKQYALDHQLPLLQPEKLKDAEFVQALREWKWYGTCLVLELSIFMLLCFRSTVGQLLSIGRLSMEIRRRGLLLFS